MPLLLLETAEKVLIISINKKVKMKGPM